jgi:hypothetical protein
MMKKILPLFIILFSLNAVFAQNRALNFDGVDDYIEVPGSSALSPSKITCETWVYITDFSTTPCADCAPIIWEQGDAYRFGTGNGQIVYLQLMNSSGVVSLNSSTKLTANAWNHIAGTFDGSKMKIYINGVCKDSSSSSFSISYSGTNDVWIADPKTGFNGTLEETRIWDYARSEAQIKEGMYRKFPSNQSGLMLQYSYEDGVPYKVNTTVSTIDDNSSYTNTGSANNFRMTDSTSNFVLGRSFCDTIAYAKFSLGRCVSYQFPSKKKTVYKSGVYQDTIMSYRGCDSVMTITLTILKPSSTNITIVQCDSFILPMNKTVVKKSGKYSEKTRNAVGCDSVISYSVTIIKKDTTYFSLSGCSSVTLKNKLKTVVYKSGLYIDSLKGYKGCDSFVRYTVLVKKPSFVKRTLKICKFLVCPSNIKKVFKKPGIYNDTLVNAVGCDSVIEYTLNSAASSSVVNLTTCAAVKSPSKKYTWTKSGTYKDTLLNKNTAGCDSFITMNLTINNPTTQNLKVTNCRSYTTPSGRHTVTNTSFVNDTLRTNGGCDSVILTIDVTINNVNTNTTRSMNTLSATTANSNALFQWLDCDNSYGTIANENKKDFTPAKDGKYAVEVTENSCKDTSMCITFAINGVKLLDKSTLNIAPNPSKGQFAINSLSTIHNAKVTLVNAQGQLIHIWNFAELKQSKLNVQVSAGIYYLNIESTEGQYHTSIIFE